MRQKTGYFISHTFLFIIRSKNIMKTYILLYFLKGNSVTIFAYRIDILIKRNMFIENIKQHQLLRKPVFKNCFYLRMTIKELVVIQNYENIYEFYEQS